MRLYLTFLPRVIHKLITLKLLDNIMLFCILHTYGSLYFKTDSRLALNLKKMPTFKNVLNSRTNLEFIEFRD